MPLGNLSFSLFVGFKFYVVYLWKERREWMNRQMLSELERVLYLGWAGQLGKHFQGRRVLSRQICQKGGGWKGEQDSLEEEGEEEEEQLGSKWPCGVSPALFFPSWSLRHSGHSLLPWQQFKRLHLTSGFHVLSLYLEHSSLLSYLLRNQILSPLLALRGLSFSSLEHSSKL